MGELALLKQFYLAVFPVGVDEASTMKPLATAYVYDVAKSANLSQPTALRAMMELVAGNLVTRVSDPVLARGRGNQRVAPFRLTPSGIQVVKLLAGEGSFWSDA